MIHASPELAVTGGETGWPKLSPRGRAPIRCVALDYGHTLDLRDGARRDRFGSFPLDPDAAETVHELTQAGYSVVIATQTRTGQLRTQALAPVRHLLRAVIHSHLIGHDKRDDGIWQAVVDAAGVLAGNIVYVGDNPATDVHEPLRRGFHAALLAPDGARPVGLPDRVPVIRHIRDLTPLLKPAHARRQATTRPASPEPEARR